MRDELAQHGEEILSADKMTFADVAEKYKNDKVHPAIIKDGHKIAGLKSYKPVKTYVKIALEHFGKRLLRTVKTRDIENFKRVRLQTPVAIEIKKHEQKLNEETKRMKYVITKKTLITPRKLSSVHRELATRIFNYAVMQG